MEAVRVLGGGRSSSVCAVSLGCSSSTRGQCRISCSFQTSLPESSAYRGTSFPSLYSRFSFFSSLTIHPLPKIPRRRSRSRIFLPHLVAATEEVQQTFIMVKPDGLQRGIVGEIITRFEKKGFTLRGLKLFQCPKELAEEHYKDLRAKPFFPTIIEYITSGPVVCMAWEGVGVVASARKLIGSTNPLEASPGTIRGDFAIQTGRNVIHGSDSPDNGKREVALWFKEEELCEWTPAEAPWLIE